MTEIDKPVDGPSEGKSTISNGSNSFLSAVGNYWQPLLVLAVAMVLFKSWEELFVVGSPLPMPDLGMGSAFLHQIYFASKAVAFLVCAVLSGHIGLLHNHRSAYGAIGALLLVATVLLTAACMAPIGSAVALCAAGTLCGGIGLGLLTLLWFELCCRFQPTATLICYLAASLVAPFVMVALLNLPFWGLVAMGVAFPAAALYCCSWGLGRAPLPAAEPRKKREIPDYRKILALIAVFGFTFGLREPLLARTPFSSGSLTALGALCVFVVVLVGLAAKGPKFNLVALVRVVLPLTAVAFLLFPTDVEFLKVISDFCSSASYDLATLLAILVFTNLCYFYSLSPVKLFGLLYGIRTACIVAGWEMWGLFQLTGIGDYEISLCFNTVSAVAIALTFLLLPDHRAMKKWGLLEERQDNAVSEEERLEHAIYLFGKKYGLTQREEDVLALIVKGRTSTQIEQELFIAKGTLKTHRRNIYAKCGVHSREEIVALLEAEER